MATREKWAKVFHTYHLYKDNIPIYFGDVKGSDASILWDGSALQISGATEFTGNMTINGNVTLEGEVTTTGETITMVVDDPEAATYAFYANIGAGGVVGWNTGNVCGIRCEVDTTCKGTINDLTAGWFGVKFDTGFTALGTGMVCAINAEVESNVARAPRAVLALQSIPKNASSDFSAMPFIYFNELATGTGSGLLFETDGVKIGSDGIFDTSTLRIKVNGSVFYLPMSTATDTFTYAGQQVGTCTSSTANNFTHVYNTLTIATNHSGSTVGLRVYSQTDGVARALGNLWGIVCGAKLVNAADATTGAFAGLLASIDMGASTVEGQQAFGIQIDLTEIVTRMTAPAAFMSFQDYDAGGNFPVKYLFDFGGTMAGISIGGGKVYNTTTLKIRVNNTDRYFPLSTAENAYTTAAVITTTNATASNSTSTGALIVTGGVGVGEDIYMAGDLYLATGKKIDFNAGDVTLTHSSGTLTLDGGVLVLTDTSTGSSRYTQQQNTLTIGSDHGGQSVTAMRLYTLTSAGTARTVGNIYGARISTVLSNVSDVIEGQVSGLQLIVDIKNWDPATSPANVTGLDIIFEEAATRATAPMSFIQFADNDYIGSFPVAYLFDLGGSLSKIGTGSTLIYFEQTLKCKVSTADMFIPLSTVEGTYTTAYPIVLSGSVVKAIEFTGTVPTAGDFDQGVFNVGDLTANKTAVISSSDTCIPMSIAIDSTSAGTGMLCNIISLAKASTAEQLRNLRAATFLVDYNQNIGSVNALAVVATRQDTASTNTGNMYAISSELQMGTNSGSTGGYAASIYVQLKGHASTVQALGVYGINIVGDCAASALIYAESNKNVLDGFHIRNSTNTMTNGLKIDFGGTATGPTNIFYIGPDKSTYFIYFGGDGGPVVSDTDTPSTALYKVKCKVGGTDCYIALFPDF